MAKKRRRSADAVGIGVTHGRAKYERTSLGAGPGATACCRKPVATPSKCTHRPISGPNAVEAAWEEYNEYNEYKKSLSLEVCSRTGAILSITWGRDDAGPRDPLSAGSTKRRKYAIHYLYDEVFGSPKEAKSAPRILMDMLDCDSETHQGTYLSPP